MQTRIPLRLGELRTAVSDQAPAALSGPVLRVCRVCAAKEARYQCPRCNLPYCSAPCYQGHGEQCTEAFFAQHVLEGAELSRGAAREATLEVLERERDAREEDAREAERGAFPPPPPEEDADRLRRLAEDPELSLDALTLDERRAFLRAVAAGELGQEPWQPWWEQSVASHLGSVRAACGCAPLVQEVGAAALGDCCRWCVAHPSDEPAVEFSALAPRGAAPTLVFHARDLLAAVALVLRRYNGDWAPEPAAAAALLRAVSAVLGAGAQPASEEEAATGFLCRVRAEPEAQGLGEVALEDAAAMLREPHFAADGFQTGWLLCGSGDKRRRRDQKKMEFFRAWAESQLSQLG